MTFAFLAFRAVHKQHDPSRCYRVVWVASLSSATVNFAYEYGHTPQRVAGGYLALLSVFGMVIFHEFLSQFEEGAEYVRAEQAAAVRAAVADLRRRARSRRSSPGRTFRRRMERSATVLNGLENLERVRIDQAEGRGRSDPGTARAGSRGRASEGGVGRSEGGSDRGLVAGVDRRCSRAGAG